MLSTTLEKALNEQIKNEFYSAYLYLAMSAYCENLNLNGFAHWLRLQSKEEASHALKIFNHINDRGGRVILESIEQPPSNFDSPLNMFKRVLEHEKNVTAQINKLYEMATKENDYPAQVMLQWFITEQVEEEKSASEIVHQLELIGDQATALLMLDRHLASRSE